MQALEGRVMHRHCPGGEAVLLFFLLLVVRTPQMSEPCGLTRTLCPQHFLLCLLIMFGEVRLVFR
jgi:hypothetical protein